MGGGSWRHFTVTDVDHSAGGPPMQKVVVRQGRVGEEGEVATFFIPKSGKHRRKLPPGQVAGRVFWTPLPPPQKHCFEGGGPSPKKGF